MRPQYTENHSALQLLPQTRTSQMELSAPNEDESASSSETTLVVTTSGPSSHRSFSKSALAAPTASPMQQREANLLLNATTEKRAAQLVTQPTDGCALHHDSRCSSDAESLDYVDELASSAFQDCRSAAQLLTAYSQSQLTSYMDAMPFTVGAASSEPPRTAQMSALHSLAGDDSEDSNEGHSSEDHADRRIEKTGESDDAADDAFAAQNTTIEVLLPVDDDDAAAVQHEGHEDARGVGCTCHGTEEITKDASSDTPESVLKVFYGKERWAGKQPTISRGDLSTRDAKLALTPAAAPSSAAPRHTDSADWVATRKTALDQLRTKFNERSTAVASRAPVNRVSSPFAQREGENAHRVQSTSNSVAHRGHALQPSDSFEDLSKVPLAGETSVSSRKRSPPRAEATTAASILDKLMGDSWVSSTTAIPQTAQPQRTPATHSGLDEGESHTSLGERSLTLVKPTGDLAGARAMTTGESGGRFIVRPALSTDVSSISPIKNEASSILADLYSTLDTRPPATAAPQPHPGSLATTTPPPRAQQRRGGPSAMEKVHEASVDAVTADFCTAQTAPSSASASWTDSPVWGRVAANATVTTAATANEIEHLPPCPRASRLNHAPPLDQGRVHSGIVLNSNDGGTAGSGLRPDAEVSVVPQSAPNSWDTSRVSKWRSSDHEGLSRLEQSVVDTYATTPSQENTALTRAAEWRQQRVKEEMRAKEMAECTFHPLLSPGTRVMVRLAQERELERTLQEEEKDAGAESAGAHTKSARINCPQPSLDSSALKATLQTVYERLYPAELSATASRRKIIDQEMEYRRLAREELILLRRRCGVSRCASRNARNNGVPWTRDTFSSFMSTILEVDWEEAATASSVPLSAAAASCPAESRTTGSAAAPVAVVQTSYKSPMAVALLEELNAKRKYNSRRKAEMQGRHAKRSGAEVVVGRGHRNGTAQSPADGTEAAPNEESFRVALFDEFLLRQNAYYFNRSRTVRELEKKMTPAFTPSTTEASTRLVQDMVSRSLLNESMGPETSSIVARRERQRIPFTSSFVKQHTSPYVNPCTFQPSISPAARASKNMERRHPSGKRETMAEQQQSFFERLYTEQQRRAQRRENAKKRAEAAEVEGLTFQPTLNVKCNTHVRSLLNPRNYQPYQAYLQEKRQLLEAKRKGQEEDARQAEEDVCSFRPQTTKKPAYIGKMAKSFGVLRQQNTEF
ncbi:hypothetical protein MNV84_06623 [Leishmania braziliensis]|nr:hypothetical protein MNV84_06623 [Leishmania braziliensis]